MEGYLAEIRLFAANFAPRTWQYCAGQVLAISTNQALFSLLGTTYGGNGVTTFALPDFRGRTPVGTGQLAGGSYYTLGELTGVENISLVSTQIPSHTHNLASSNLTANLTPNSFSDSGTTDDPNGNYFAAAGAMYNASNNATGGAWPVTVTGGAQVAVAGASQPHENRMPYLGMNYIICIQGIFPSRN